VPFGRYELLELLGEGAMAQVFRARQRGPLGFSKEVAVKRLRRDVAHRDRAELEALVNEARVGGRLKHPNLVEIYGCEVVNGSLCITMEYVRGWTLDQVLWRFSKVGATLPVDTVLDILRQLAQGLSSAHGARDEHGSPLGLVHRDLKPQNIFLDLLGGVKIADFGLAKSSVNLYRTQEDQAKGSPLYMSPEQVNGDPVDHRSDLFALGTVAIELATGRWAFDGKSIAETLARVLAVDCDEAWKALGRLAPQLQPIVSRLLQAKPEDRFPSAKAAEQQFLTLAGPVVTTTHTLPLVHALLGHSNLPPPYAQLSFAFRENRLHFTDDSVIDEEATWEQLPTVQRGTAQAGTGPGGAHSPVAGRTPLIRLAVLAAGGLLLIAMAALLSPTNPLPGDPALDAPVMLSAMEPAGGNDLSDRRAAAVPSPAMTTGQSTDPESSVVHQPIAAARLWQDVTITARMREPGSWRLSCHYRPAGGADTDWRIVDLQAGDDGQFMVGITITERLGTGMLYFLEAWDETQDERRTLGSTAQPFRVLVE